MNRQQVLPLLQALVLPIYWLIGRLVLGLEALPGIVFTLAAPFAAHVVVVGIGFVVSYRNQHEEKGVRHSRRRDWLIAYVREAGESLRQFYWLMPFRERFRVPEASTPLRGLRIVLIHGYGCNRGLWLPAARWFSRRGYRVSAISLRPMHCPIEHYADAIAGEIARVVGSDPGGAPVALIGHSMGGLAARSYLRRCAERGDDPKVAALITLGTPHRGTHLAVMGLGENARQMRYGSQWLEELGMHEDGPACAAHPPLRRLRVTAIASLQDNIVSRPLEQRLRGGRTILLRRQGHMSLATTPRVFRLLDRILARAAAAAAAEAGSPA